MRVKFIVVAAIAVVASLLTPGVASAAEDEARIHLIHGIVDTEVDVEVDGELVIENYKFGDTFDLSGFAGQTLKNLQVKLAGTDTVAIDAGDTSLPASGNYTVVAHLDGEANPTLAVFENDTAKIDAGKGRLTVRHAAAAPAVDVLANGDVAFANVLNGKGSSADLDIGTISATVVPTGETSPVVIGPAELKIEEGQSLVVTLLVPSKATA